MVIFDSDVRGVTRSEPKADSPLPIDADRHLSGPITFKPFQAVARRVAQVQLRAIASSLDERGFCIVPEFLGRDEIDFLVEEFDASPDYPPPPPPAGRKTSMRRGTLATSWLPVKGELCVLPRWDERNLPWDTSADGRICPGSGLGSATRGVARQSLTRILDSSTMKSRPLISSGNTPSSFLPTSRIWSRAWSLRRNTTMPEYLRGGYVRMSEKSVSSVTIARCSRALTDATSRSSAPPSS